MIRLFCGYDEREAIGFHVFMSSVIRKCSEPFFFTPVFDKERTDGSNAFTYARYKIAEQCGFEGWAIFVDACDMLMVGDLSELWALRDERFAVQVVKHSYKTRNPIKYLGTTMQCINVDYERKNWSSVMLINCGAPEWKTATISGKEAHQFKGFADDRIGELPAKWNVLIDEGHSVEDAKLYHWTAGIPGFPIYSSAPESSLWHEEYSIMGKCNV